MRQRKAASAGNGSISSKGGTAVMAHLRGSLRARAEAAICCVALATRTDVRPEL
jgi:hypothetical protein